MKHNGYYRRRLPAAAVSLMALLLLAGAVFAVWAAVQPAPAGSGERRAVWVSYLELEQMDLSNEAAARAAFERVMEDAAAAGLNTVILQVRPFGDALYESAVFPWSHLLTGRQGQDPGYDPLALACSLAHAKGLRLEAWVNPYRVKGGQTPAVLADENPALLWQQAPETAGWVHTTDTGLWYDPGIPQVQALILRGVAELCENYPIDGVQFDDYFYPATDPAFDAAAWRQYGGGLPLEDWRRENVNTLIREAFSICAGAGVEFGVSPQGNLQNNLDQQYSDLPLWMAEGWVDYVCPQIYWGFDWRSADGGAEYAFDNCLQSWLALPRAEGVSLYVGLGAFRIGGQDGSAAGGSEWSGGQVLAKMVEHLRSAGAQGYVVYRYGSLWREDALCKTELSALCRQNSQG